MSEQSLEIAKQVLDLLQAFLPLWGFLFGWLFSRRFAALDAEVWEPGTRRRPQADEAKRTAWRLLPETFPASFAAPPEPLRYVYDSDQAALTADWRAVGSDLWQVYIEGLHRTLDTRSADAEAGDAIHAHAST